MNKKRFFSFLSDALPQWAAHKHSLSANNQDGRRGLGCIFSV